MIFSTINERLGVERMNEFVKAAEDHRRARQLSPKRSFSLPNLNKLFAGWKSEEKTTVGTQAG